LIVLDPLNFRRYYQILLNLINNTADALLHTFIKSSDYQAHFTAVFDIATSLFSLNNHLGP